LRTIRRIIGRIIDLALPARLKSETGTPDTSLYWEPENRDAELDTRGRPTGEYYQASDI